MGFPVFSPRAPWLTGCHLASEGNPHQVGKEGNNELRRRCGWVVECQRGVVARGSVKHTSTPGLRGTQICSAVMHWEAKRGGQFYTFLYLLTLA